MKKIIIGIAIGIILTGTTVYATYKYQAGEVGYTPSNSNFKVDNVESAINELYTKVTTGPTMETVSGATHQGIVYLDPTDLTKKCTASNSSSETEKKTDCMKWYIFDDSGDNYTMILDHNTTARIKWNDSNSNVAVGSSNVAGELTALVNTSGWKVMPRLITVEEVVAIVGGVSTWKVADYNTWFYFEGTGNNKQTMSSYSTTRSKYAWLYDNLYGCRGGSGTDWGCEIEDNKNDYEGTGTAGNGPLYFYWTSTPVGTPGSSSEMWSVGYAGRLVHPRANYSDPGIRPVITISKSIIK